MAEWKPRTLKTGEYPFKVIENISNERKYVGKIAKELEADQSDISNILSMLKEIGFVEKQKDGRKSFYSLSSEGRRYYNLRKNLNQTKKEIENMHRSINKEGY